MEVQTYVVLHTLHFIVTGGLCAFSSPTHTSPAPRKKHCHYYQRSDLCWGHFSTATISSTSILQPRTRRKAGLARREGEAPGTSEHPQCARPLPLLHRQPHTTTPTVQSSPVRSTPSPPGSASAASPPPSALLPVRAGAALPAPPTGRPAALEQRLQQRGWGLRPLPQTAPVPGERLRAQPAALHLGPLRQ